MPKSGILYLGYRSVVGCKPMLFIELVVVVGQVGISVCHGYVCMADHFFGIFEISA